MPPVREGGEALSDVAAAADFQDVAAQGVGALLGYDDRRLRLVLGARRAAPGPPAGASGLGGVVGIGILVVGGVAVVEVSALVGVGVLALRGGVGVAVAAIGCRGGGVIRVFEEVLLAS